MWSCLKPFGMDEIHSWTFWVGPDFKDLLAWTKCLYGYLGWTKYDLIPGMFWHRPNVLWMFWTGPDVYKTLHIAPIQTMACNGHDTGAMRMGGIAPAK